MRHYDNHRSGTVQRARQLRRDASEPERRLLRALRETYPHLKWRHQAPLGPFFADMLCFAEKLVIEVDGDTHAAAEGYDASREDFMAREGYRTVRVSNADVMQNLEGVLTQISFSLGEKEGPRAAKPRGKDEGGLSREKGQAGMNRTRPHPSAATRLPPSPNGRGSNGSLGLFELVDGVLGGGRQANRVALHLGDQADRQVMMLGALPVLGLRAVVLGQLDAIAIDMIDGADMDAVRADDFGMFLDLADIDHLTSPVLGSGSERATLEMVA